MVCPTTRYQMCKKKRRLSLLMSIQFQNTVVQLQGKWRLQASKMSNDLNCCFHGNLWALFLGGGVALGYLRLDSHDVCFDVFLLLEKNRSVICSSTHFFDVCSHGWNTETVPPDPTYQRHGIRKIVWWRIFSMNLSFRMIILVDEYLLIISDNFRVSPEKWRFMITLW